MGTWQGAEESVGLLSTIHVTELCCVHCPV